MGSCVIINPMGYANKEVQAEYQRLWMAKRRSEWFECNGPCRRCGSWKDLELDHIDPTHKVSHRIWSWSEQRRNAELAKCQALCYECHKKKTADQLACEITHGTAGGYARGCRCEYCKGWRRAKRRAELSNNGGPCRWQKEKELCGP